MTEVALPALMKPLPDGTFVHRDDALMSEETGLIGAGKYQSARAS